MVKKVSQKRLIDQIAISQKRIEQIDHNGDDNGDNTSGRCPPNKIQKVSLTVFIDGIVIKKVDRQKE